MQQILCAQLSLSFLLQSVFVPTLGCSPTYLPDSFGEQVEGVTSGFFCPCHGSKFDMAGRVFQGVPAPLNLVIPPHQYVDDGTVIIGVDKGGGVMVKI